MSVNVETLPTADEVLSIGDALFWLLRHRGRIEFVEGDYGPQMRFGCWVGDRELAACFTFGAPISHGRSIVVGPALESRVVKTVREIIAIAAREAP